MTAYVADSEVINPTLQAEGVSRLDDPLMPSKYTEARGSRERRSRNIAGIGCCICCFIFLVLFFFIPRTPRVQGVDDMSGMVVSQNISNPNFVIQATYQLYNPNPYQIKVNKLQTQITTQTIATTPSVPIYVITGTGDWPLGQSSVTIESSSYGDVPIWYSFNGTDSSRRTAIYENIKQCCHSYSTIITSGNIDVTSWLTSYSVDTGDLVTSVICQC